MKKVLHTVKEERNIPPEKKNKKKKKGREANWKGHILRTNRLLKHVIEGTIEV
jgi:hypothetical protein